MAEYYLVSQLPSLDGVNENSPLPITEEVFLELCERLLNKKMFGEIKNLTLVPSLEFEKSNSPLIDAWNDGERNLRLALGKARADKMSKPFDLQKNDLPAEIIKVANTAVETKNPLDAEYFLLNHRLSFLETLRPLDSFSDEYIFYYALKLKLIFRIKQFNKNLGEATYKKIYSCVLKEI